MKTKILTHTAALIAGVLIMAGCSGCQTKIGGMVDGLLPEGSATKVTYQRGGMVSNTTVEAVNYRKTDDRVTADKLTIDHNNIYVPRLYIELENYDRQRSPAESEAK